MNEIICPHCSKAFKVDEAGYASAHFSDRGRPFHRDGGRRFSVIVDDHGSAQATGWMVGDRPRSV